MASDALDPNLIERARRGDEQAWSCIVKEMTPRLLAQVDRIVQDLEESRDILQMTFVDAYLKLDRFRGGSLEAWLYCAATRRAVRFGSRLFWRYRRGRVPLEVETDESAAQPGEVVQYPTCSAQVLWEADRRLKIACQSLPRPQGEVFVARAIEHLSFREIARRLGEVESTARCQFTRAREQLRRMLEDDPAIQALRIWEES